MKKIIQFYKNELKKMHDLKSEIENENENILSLLLQKIDLPNTKDHRFSAFERLVNLKEETLEMSIKKLWCTDTETFQKMSLVYDFVSDFHLDVQKNILGYIKQNKLLPSLYEKIIEWVYDVGVAFSPFYKARHNQVILTQNRLLEEKFNGEGDKIIAYLDENNLFDTGYNDVRADRCYSTVVGLDRKEDIQVLTYHQCFHKEVSEIVTRLEKLVKSLENETDEVYEMASAYREYFIALINAFNETNRHETLKKWGEVDRKWMKIKSPIQVSHPLEYYEDMYRKAVAPEWDIRFMDKEIMETSSEKDIFSMYETMYNTLGREKYASSYHFSLENMKRVQLYISQPIFYFGSELSKRFSAQVVPNDEMVSKEEGKKIFAFPEFVFSGQKNNPIMKLQVEIMGSEFVADYKKLLWNEKMYYKIYDIETIGHEYGHTLWLDTDSEVKIGKTWNFKNIEEWKATAGWLCAYFYSWETSVDDEVFLLHIERCVKLQRYREIEDTIPYYCESIIHLHILFGSKMLSFDWKSLCFDMTKKEEVKKMYFEVYGKLVLHYLDKKDASLFLSEYTVKEGKYFLAKDKKVKDFCEHYYARYKEIWSEIFSD